MQAASSLEQLGTAMDHPLLHLLELDVQSTTGRGHAGRKAEPRHAGASREQVTLLPDSPDATQLLDTAGCVDVMIGDRIAPDLRLTLVASRVTSLAAARAIVVGPIWGGAADGVIAWSTLMETLLKALQEDETKLLKQVTDGRLYLRTIAGDEVEIAELVGQQRSWTAAQESMADKAMLLLLERVTQCVHWVGLQGQGQLADLHADLPDLVDMERMPSSPLDSEMQDRAMSYLQQQHQDGSLARVMEARKNAAGPSPVLAVLTTAGGRSLAGLGVGELGAAMAYDPVAYLHCKDLRTQAGLVLLAPKLAGINPMGLQYLSTPAQCSAGADRPRSTADATWLALAVLTETPLAVGPEARRAQLQRGMQLCGEAHTPKKPTGGHADPPAEFKEEGSQQQRKKPKTA